jgi:hypothetical protein
MRTRRTKHGVWCRLAIGVGGVSLLMATGGCALVNAAILQEFVTDFARSALAAWLL